MLVSVVAGQSDFENTVKEYYRVNPFQGTFSTFIDVLTKDSALLNKQILKQTDSTGYYVRGEYEVFNPFSVNANKVDMIFYESSLKARNDFHLFNFYTYQLTSYFPDTELTRKAIKKDYKKLARKFKRDLYYTDIKSLKGYNNIEDGEISTYNNYNTSQLAPVVISWQTLSASKQLGLTIIVRIRQLNNYAVPVNNM
ncbi:hypothetical protein [Niabella ginsengisoli]|uniref:DUF4390 domain-containing protein n=1 Tax=Niabella ginsengisoli TaxID=522298 RepID=A0ABS9SQQ7_9BACT|nr:hypothetical protein [Niabella ginsengisoli]MCH5600697.1 hypothetical protein [Niabella ginsengisoli]